MSQESLTVRIAKTVYRHRRRIFVGFLLLWSLLLILLACFWAFDIARDRHVLSQQEYVIINVVFIAFVIMTQAALIFGYLLYRKRKSLLPLTSFLAIVSLIALVPIWSAILT